MIIEIGLMILAGAATLGGDRGLKKLKKKFIKPKRSYQNGALPEHAWKNLRQHIVNDCRGYMYADALIESIMNTGYYFRAVHIYELRDIYKKRGWLGNESAKQHVDKLTDYEHICKFDADDRVFDIMAG